MDDNFNKFNNMIITKNDDGTYYLKGQTNGGGYVEIFSANITLIVDVINSEDSETMMTITYEQIQ